MGKLFVSYMRSRYGLQGVGNCELTCNGPVSGIRDINWIQREIEKSEGFETCVVLSWQRFEDEDSVAMPQG